MPDLLLELRSEEIPARMQRKAAGDLKKLVTDGLVEAGLTYEAAREYWTPRRLTLDLRGVTARSKDVREEIKGPSTKAPEQAVQGFLRKAGLASVDEARVQSDPRKGDFYVAVLSRPGRAAEEIIAELVPAVIRAFPWPKSMRWGKASAKPGALRWVRPLQSILCTFGPETSDPVVVDFEVDGIRSGNVTYGHRFHAPEPFTVRRFEDYVAKLEAARVVLDSERRKRIIHSDARNLAFAAGLELVEDEGLLEEVAGLVEWPVVLMGEFEEAFLDIPAEIIRLTIRANQKCFVARPRAPISPFEGEMSAKPTEGGAVPPASPERGREPPPSALPGISPSRGEIGQSALSNRFILTSNIEARDGGAEIARGNGKVVRARLSDAVHFWKTDQADLPDLDQLKTSAERLGLDLTKPLDQRMARLDHLGVTFHAKLGTQGERVERIARLAEEIASVVGADAALAGRAALLAKADLQTEVVGEFPELQGAMGKKYALLQGEHPSVAAAIEEHYRPQGPSDSVPTDPVAIAVALADKLDTLVGFWAIEEKPTGSKDPYALRRAALGVIRILVENGVRLGLLDLPIYRVIEPNTKSLTRISVLDDVEHHELNRWELDDLVEAASNDELSDVDTGTLETVLRYARKQFDIEQHRDLRARDNSVRSYVEVENTRVMDFANPHRDLLSFFHDRLKVYLRDKGARHDLIDAVLASGGAPISPLEGEMSAKPTEGGVVPPSSPERGREAPPSALPGISPSRGEIGQSPMAQLSAPPPPGPSGHPPRKGEGGGANDDLLLIVRRVEALGALLETETGRNLLAGTRRAVNILAAEEKKGTRIAASVDPALLREDAERALFEAVDRAESEAGRAIAAQDYAGAMGALGALREPIDAFFEAVLVNDEDEAVRANRLALLARIRAATGQVADFSRIAG